MELHHIHTSHTGLHHPFTMTSINVIPATDVMHSYLSIYRIHETHSVDIEQSNLLLQTITSRNTKYEIVTSRNSTTEATDRLTMDQVNKLFSDLQSKTKCLAKNLG